MNTQIIKTDGTNIDVDAGINNSSTDTDTDTDATVDRAEGTLGLRAASEQESYSTTEIAAGEGIGDSTEVTL